MKKDTVKNILLIASVLLTFVLVFQIWFSGYFMPGGYDYLISSLQNNIVTPITKLFFQKDSGSFSENIKMLLKPEKIVVNNQGQRRVYGDGQCDYGTVKNLSEQIMSDFISGKYQLKSKETVTVDAYSATLRGKSIFVDYGKNCDYRLFSAALCGQASTRYADDLSAVSAYVISLQDGILNDIAIYVTDQKSGNTYRYLMEANKTDIAEDMEALFKKEAIGSSPSYAFELNFHKEQADSATKILFEPMILMDLMPVSVPSVKGQTIADFDHTLDEDMLNTVLRTFSINTRTMHRYVDLSDARVFVENDATLTLYPDGLLEYQTMGNGWGLNISEEKTTYDIYAASTDAVNFVTKLCSHMPPAFFEHLRIRTDLVEEMAREGVYRIFFDYCIDGIPVRHDSGNGLSHTIEMEIEKGNLKSYRQFVKAYEKAENVGNPVEPMLTAADALVDQLYSGVAPLRISDINICYVEGQDGVIVPKWYAVVDGQEKIV